MGRLAIMAGILLALSGCGQFGQWPRFAHAGPTAPGPARYDFGWRLSGDRSVAPLQVFDDGRRMWLQFAPNAPVPAIFSRSRRGDTLMTYEQRGPYVIIQGVWPLLVLRGGGLQSVVERLDEASGEAPKRPEGKDSSDPAPAVGVPAAQGQAPREEGRANSGTDAVSGRAARPTAEPAGAHTASSPRPAPKSIPALVSAPAPILGSAPVLESGPGAAPEPVYAVTPSDRNIRLALVRWANIAGWTFGAAHWAVDVDIPIVGAARFEPGFKHAVRSLLASTELSERPLQACFYSNRVLRVVSYAQACDRTADRAGLS